MKSFSLQKKFSLWCCNSKDLSWAYTFTLDPSTQACQWLYLVSLWLSPCSASNWSASIDIPSSWYYPLLADSSVVWWHSGAIIIPQFDPIKFGNYATVILMHYLRLAPILGELFLAISFLVLSAKCLDCTQFHVLLSWTTSLILTVPHKNFHCFQQSP